MMIFHSYVSLPEGMFVEMDCVELFFDASGVYILHRFFGRQDGQAMVSVFTRLPREKMGTQMNQHNARMRNGDGSNSCTLVNIKIAGKWMLIPLKLLFIGTDP